MMMMEKCIPKKEKGLGNNIFKKSPVNNRTVRLLTGIDSISSLSTAE
jgi:hypothetical protein